MSITRTTNTLIINKLVLAASVDTSPGLALVPNPGTGEYIELSVTTSRWVGELVQTPIAPSEFPIGPTTITQIDDLSDSTDISMGHLVEVRQEPSLQVTNLAKVGNLIISTPVPVDPIGEFGDVVGMIRTGDDGIYYCSADFNGVDEIWKFARFVPSPIGWDDVNDKPQIMATGSTIEEAREAIGLGTLVMADITDKQGKVLDDLTLIEDVADIDTTFAVGGYIIKEDALNGAFAGATMLVSANGGAVSQLISVPLVGKIGLRRYDGVWGDLSFTIAPTDVMNWYASTTATAADAVINADGTFSREVSTEEFKRDIEPMQDSYADALLNARPVFYRSKCAADPKDWSYWGFIAEELAEIDPRLVRWGHAMKAVEQPNGLPPKMVEDKDSPLVPIGVQYSRLTVPLLQLAQRQGAAIEALEARLDALEAKL